MAITPGSLIGRKLLRGFGRDERGVTAIEFGLLAVPFFAIIGAILETSLVFLSGQLLDSAVQDVSRLIRTGQARSTMFSADDFRKNVCERLFGLFGDCKGLYVEVRSVTNFADIDVKAPINPNCTLNCDAWAEPDAFTPGQGSSIMVVEAYYKWPIIINLGGLNLSNLPGGKRLMGAAAVFRNEPFT